MKNPLTPEETERLLLLLLYATSHQLFEGAATGVAQLGPQEEGRQQLIDAVALIERVDDWKRAHRPPEAVLLALLDRQLRRVKPPSVVEGGLVGLQGMT